MQLLCVNSQHLHVDFMLEMPVQSLFQGYALSLSKERNSLKSSRSHYKLTISVALVLVYLEAVYFLLYFIFPITVFLFTFGLIILILFCGYLNNVDIKSIKKIKTYYSLAHKFFSRFPVLPPFVLFYRQKKTYILFISVTVAIYFSMLYKYSYTCI